MPTLTSADGTAIAYDITGDGPLLITVFGATCFRQFMPVLDDVKKFATSFRVINYDRRGRGDSGDTQPWSLEKEIDDIRALIQANGGSAMIYGHSSGAVLALEAALRLPDLITHVMVYDAPYCHDEAEVARYAQLRTTVDALLDKGEHKKALRTFLLNIGMPKPFVYLLPLMPGYRTMLRLAPTLRYDMTLTKDTPPLTRLSAITQPALLMVGAKNGPGTRAVHHQLSEALPHAMSRQIEGQDHMVNINTILPVVDEFLQT